MRILLENIDKIQYLVVQYKRIIPFYTFKLMGDFDMDNLRRGILLFTALLFFAATVIGFILSLDYYDTATVMEAVPDWHYDGQKVSAEDAEGKGLVNENILVVIGDEGDEHSEIMFITNYNSEKNKMSFIYVPKDMKYSLNVKNIPGGKFSGKSSYNSGTMSQLYSRFGGKYSADIMSYMFDVPVDNYVFLSFNDCKTLFNGFTGQDKGLLFNFPVKVTNVEEDVSLSAGEQYFDGDMAIDLLRFYKTADGIYDNSLLQYYDGTDLKRIDMVKKFMADFLDSQLLGDSVNKYYLDNFAKISYESVIKKCDTNITSALADAVQKSLSNIKEDSVSFYILDYKTADNNEFLLEHTGCLKDITNNDSSKHKSLSKEATSKVISEKFN
ncbi:MAG: LytR family transcriptional regulator [Ruminococcaceae bacterium]|nr:LytR family transcriptional regulator [Oscillospiraceae bacterium]